MPIRTHRGRAAVYRTFWGWPLRSPRHLAGVVLVLVVCTVGVVLALPDDSRGPGVAAPSNTRRDNPFDPASRAALPGTRPGQFSPPAPPSATPPLSPEAPAEALATARAWVTAFLHAPPGISSAQWAEQLRPYTTEELFPVLLSINPANVPEAEIIGNPRTISSGAGKAEVDVATTAGVVRLLLVPTPAGWRVSGYEQAG